MSKELLWLTLTVILTGLMWIPYILDRIIVRGLMGAMANPSRNDKPQSPWAQRLYFAHTNAVENLVIFAALVLILNAMHHSTMSTVIACAVSLNACSKGWKPLIAMTNHRRACSRAIWCWACRPRC